VSQIKELPGNAAKISAAARQQGRSRAVRLAGERADITAVDICPDIPAIAYPDAPEEDLDETVRQVEALDRRMIASVTDGRRRLRRDRRGPHLLSDTSRHATARACRHRDRRHDPHDRGRRTRDHQPQAAAPSRWHCGGGARPGRTAIGGRGRSGIQSESLDKECTVPVQSGMETGRLTGQPLLLVGFDGSAAAWRAAAWALGQARRQRARLVFVYISVIPAWAAFAPELVPHGRASLAKLAAGIADQLDAVLGEADVSWEFLHREGHPATELARAADVLRADAVVVGASRHWLRRAGLSAAGGLLRSGHWPVTVVP
jgi:nucleotide-binding universal stress UspA family protein